MIFSRHRRSLLFPIQMEESFQRIFQLMTLGLIAMVFITSGCQAPQVSTSTVEVMPVSSPTRLPETPTQKEPVFVPPTQTLSVPSATSEPTTAVSGISGELSSPPLLAYNKVLDGQEQVILVNQDGSALKTIPLPNHGYTYGDLSANGEWLIFYTESSNDPSNDLALNLMHLPDGQTRLIARLLPEDYPDNLRSLPSWFKPAIPSYSPVSLYTGSPLIFKNSLLAAFSNRHGLRVEIFWLSLGQWMAPLQISISMISKLKRSPGFPPA